MEIEAEVRGFIFENFIIEDPEELGEEESLLERGIIDSTGVLELVAFIEEKYGITIEDDELIPENLDSIRNIIDFIRRKIKKPLSKKGASPPPIIKLQIGRLKMPN